MTHTYAILPLSIAAYEEIRRKLEAAGYEDQFHDDVIDMHGLAIQPEPGRCSAVVMREGIPTNCNVTKVRCIKCGREWCLDHQPHPLACPDCGDRPYR